MRAINPRFYNLIAVLLPADKVIPVLLSAVFFFRYWKFTFMNLIFIGKMFPRKFGVGAEIILNEMVFAL